MVRCSVVAALAAAILMMLCACAQPRTVCTSRQVVDVPDGGMVEQEKTVTVCEREITGGRGG